VRLLVAIAVTWFAGSAAAETTVRELTWLTAAALPDGAELNADGSLSVSSATQDGLTVTLIEIDEPGISASRYAVEGRLRHEGVDGEGYVEMWSEFADGSRFFSRTNQQQGPMRSFSGNSGWRCFVLPFDATGSASTPVGLTLNVILPGRGVVTLDALTLVELEPGEWPSGVNDRAVAGRVAGTAGATLGIIGGVLGWLGGRGKAKRLVLSGLRTLMAAGAIALAVGVICLIQGMAYAVYYPLMLIGLIALLVPAWVLPRLTQRYQEIELRRMSALDA
jgi:hypothetical protein